MEWIGATPWDHQQVIVENATRGTEYGIFAEMGTGKSFAAINIMRRWFAGNLRVLRTLILCPPIVIDNWKREITKYSKIDGRRVVMLNGSGEKRRVLFEHHASVDKGTIFITNYESLLMPELFKKIQQWRPELLIFDESHRCKEMSTKRTKAAIKLADKSRYRLLLTGSPILNSAMDIFAQFRIMDGGQTFGKSFVQFRANYFYDENHAMPKHLHFPKWVPRPDTYERLFHKINSKSMTVKKKDCLTLPPLVEKTVYVELSSAQKKAYAEMKKHLITFIDGGACTASLALTKALRLMQIVSGFASVEVAAAGGGKERAVARFKDDPRAVALRDLLAEICEHSKCLVWAVFKENYDTIRDVCESLGLGYVEIHGEVTAKTKQEAIKRLEEDPSVKVLIGHPGSGGIGVNLVAASYSIRYSRTFSLEHYLQSNARNYRGGSERHASITQIELVAKDTIDEVVRGKLAEKISISDAILLDVAKQL